MSETTETRLALIEHEIDGYDKIFPKLDETIVKINEMSLSIKESIGSHTAQLENISINIANLNSAVSQLDTRLQAIEKYKFATTYFIYGALFILGMIFKSARKWVFSLFGMNS